MTVYNEMVSRLLANYLIKELSYHDNQINGTGDDAGTFFPVISRQFNPKDFDKFVKTIRNRIRRLEKDANGCPERLWEWQQHYLGEEQL